MNRLFLQARRFLGGEWLALAMLLTPATVRANLGPPQSGGQIVAEPVGIKDVVITRESLTIDLRPLARNGLARVEAVYHLHNSGTEKKLDLLFASGSVDMADFRVWLGDQPVACSPAAGAPLPASWQAPRSTPSLRGGKVLDYVSGRGQQPVPMALTVRIPPGAHTLKVCYAAEATVHRRGRPTVYHQFAYILAPARTWAGFGGLDVTIHLPTDWRAACTPELRRQGDTLRATFADVPADAIALTVQAPEGWAYRLVAYGAVGLLLLVGLGGAILCWRSGRSKGRLLAVPSALPRSWLQRHAWPLSLGLGMVWSMAVLAAGFLAIFAPDWVLPTGQVAYYGYGQFFAQLGVFFLSILAAPIGFGITQITAIRAHKRTLAESRAASASAASGAEGRAPAEWAIRAKKDAI